MAERVKDNFQKKTLSNGMTVIFEKREVPVVSVAFASKVGGINEDVEEKGIYHFMEHLLLKRTSSRGPTEISAEIEDKGGSMNAMTSEEFTAYHCKLPSQHLDSALDVLSDAVKNPVFDSDDLEKERKVIFEEIKMHHDNPIRYVFDEIQDCLFTGTMGMNLAGTHETMNSLKREDLKRRFEEAYRPDNLILCVVGNADFDKVVQFAENSFSQEKSEVSEQEFEEKKESKTEEREGIDQANLVFAYHVPKAEEKGSYAAKVLSSLMADGMSSRLFEEIREKRNLAYAVKGGEDISKNFAFNFVYVGTTKDKVEEVKGLILKEFEKVAENLTGEELEKIKQKMIGSHKVSMEDSEDQMSNLIESEIESSAEEFYDFEENVSQVDLEEVKDLAKKVADGNYSFFALVPKDSEE
ncbi:MAG: M16 family metallopeptidase [Candidatus Pacearchaeota archaeon]